MRSGMTLSGLAPQIERAFKVPRVKAVALAINSPGGSPVQSALISQRIRDLSEEKKVPVIAFAEDVAASGGYWLACAGDEIYANENSIVGSIGVVSAGFGFPELIKRFGVERRVHSAGDRKAMLDPFREENPKDVARLKALHKEIHESFKDHVRTRRGAHLKGSEKSLFNGDIWTGRQAVELGLIDGLGELRHVLRQRYGEKLRLKRVDGARPWWRRLPMGAEWSPADLPSSQTWAAGLLAAVEERALWARYGL
jgi:serine protease SohB